MPLPLGIVATAACLYLATTAAAASDLEVLPPYAVGAAVEAEPALLGEDIIGDAFDERDADVAGSSRGSSSSSTTVRAPTTPFYTWSLLECVKHAVCYRPKKPCGIYETNYVDEDMCACLFPFPADYKCNENSMADMEVILGCDSGLCSKHREPYGYTDTWSTAMPLALATGTCFIVAATAMIACKMFIRRMNNAMPTRRGDGDAESVNSMQRWINERLRDRPPRYEEMLSLSPQQASPPALGVPTVSAVVTETEKPPPYETAVNETQTTSFCCQPAADGSPPPPYTAEDFVDCGQGYSNPCFVGDNEEPPPYTASSPSSSLATLLSLSTLTDSSSSTAAAMSASSSSSSTPMSSLSSSTFTFTSSSVEDDDALPANLLTVSQAVALRDMVLVESGASGRAVVAAP